MLILEIAARVFSPYQTDLSFEATSNELYRYDSLLGYSLISGLETKAWKMNNEDTVYSVNYSTDEYGRRHHTRQDSCNEFIALFGCSNVFGTGLDKDKALPSKIADRFPRKKIYNYGTPGYGTAQLTLMMEERNLAAEIKETRGIGIYAFLDDHIPRTLGSMKIVNSWGKDMPYYKIMNGNPAFMGSFSTAKKTKTFLYYLLGKSALLNLTGIDLPLNYSDEDYDLIVLLIKNMQKSFNKRFPDSEFMVYLHPSEIDISMIYNRLLSKKIKVLDLSGLYSKYDPEYIIEGDLHPNGKANSLIAKELAKYIQSDISIPIDTGVLR